jgi:hypothetical protein
MMGWYSKLPDGAGTNDTKDTKHRKLSSFVSIVSVVVARAAI